MKFTEREIVTAICAFIIGFLANTPEGIKLFHGKPKKLPIIAYGISGSCHFCNQLMPILDKLKPNYEGKLNFIKLDLSSDETKKGTDEIAKEYGLSDFVSGINSYPTLGLFCPNGGNKVKIIAGLHSEEDYVKEFDNFTKDISTFCARDGSFLSEAMI